MSGRSDLGLPDDAPVADIKARFRERAKIAHPDTGGNSEMFRRLRDAYGRALSEPPRPKGTRACESCGGSGKITLEFSFLHGIVGDSLRCSRCRGSGVEPRTTETTVGSATTYDDFDFDKTRRARWASGERKPGHADDCECPDCFMLYGTPAYRRATRKKDRPEDGEDRAARLRKEAFATCEECGGKGYRSSPTGGGQSIKRPCIECAAVGKRLRPGTCLRCQGGGRVTVYVGSHRAVGKTSGAEARSEECPSCEGAGTCSGAYAAR